MLVVFNVLPYFDDISSGSNKYSFNLFSLTLNAFRLVYLGSFCDRSWSYSFIILKWYLINLE